MQPVRVLSLPLPLALTYIKVNGNFIFVKGIVKRTYEVMGMQHQNTLLEATDHLGRSKKK